MSNKQQIPEFPLYYQSTHTEDVSISPSDIVIDKHELESYIEEMVEYVLEQAAGKAIASAVGHSGEPVEGVTAHVWPLSILSLQDQIIKDLKL